MKEGELLELLLLQLEGRAREHGFELLGLDQRPIDVDVRGTS